jgi:hypothetical protein
MNFQKITSAPWIERAQLSLPFSLPRCFTDFACRYVFTEFEIERLHHYDNYDGNEKWCWHAALFSDQAIYKVCSANLFLPIGQPEASNYDRVCLDLNRLKSGDCPVVQLDHEAILLKEKIKIVTELAPSYKKLISNVLTSYYQLDQTDPSTSSG